MAETEIIDLTHLEMMTGGDDALAVEVIGIFRHQGEIWGRLLNAAEPPASWADAAHTIKGAAASIGAHKLAEICAAAEALGRSGAVSPTRASLMLADVREELNRTTDAAARLAHRLEGSSGFRASKDSNS